MTGSPNFFSLPVGANPSSDQRVGVDELGRPVYRALNGQQYATGETYAPAQRYESDPGSLARVRDVVGNMVRGGVDAFTSGVSAPARAYRGEPVTYGDAFEAAGMAQLGGAAMPAPRGALRSAALRSADDVAETPAAQVARLLREGRASEVTDDLMAQVDPQEMYRLYEGGATGQAMPMDEASRMARAGEMGFDTDRQYYHGTNAEFSEMRPSTTGKIGPGVYMTDNPTFAGAFASDNPEMSGRVLPLTAQRYEAVPDFVRSEARAARSAERDIFDGANAYSDLMRRYGYDGVEVQDQRTVLTPTNIRSRFARFDPRLSHLANLSAANASPMTGLMGAQAGNRDEEIQRLAAYLAAQGGLN